MALLSVLEEVVGYEVFEAVVILPLFISCFSPYKILRSIWWCMRWHAKFTIGGEPYGQLEKVYLTRLRLGLSEAQWEVGIMHALGLQAYLSPLMPCVDTVEEAGSPS